MQLVTMTVCDKTETQPITPAITQAKNCLNRHMIVKVKSLHSPTWHRVAGFTDRGLWARCFERSTQTHYTRNDEIDALRIEVARVR